MNPCATNRIYSDSNKKIHTSSLNYTCYLSLITSFVVTKYPGFDYFVEIAIFVLYRGWW